MILIILIIGILIPQAKKCKKIKYEIRVLKRFLKYQKKYGETDNMRGIKAELQTLGYDNFDNLESSEGESSVGGGDADTTHIGDDVRLEELSCKLLFIYLISILNFIITSCSPPLETA